MAANGQSSTRERIIAEAMRLFADRGYRGSTVGEIEEAAGLSPRSGGFYKHFRSKQEVLAAGIERHVTEIEAMRSVLDLMPLGDLRAELTLIARWALAELGDEQPLMRVVQKDGDQFPELVAQVHERIVSRGHREASKLIGRLLADARVEGLSPDALAAVALGSLVNYRIEETMFGVPPAGIGEEEFVEAWVEVWTAVAQGGAMEARAEASEAAR
jgi:AcrR family transcriptional regulator